MSVGALKENNKPKITCLYLYAKRNLISHLKCNRQTKRFNLLNFHRTNTNTRC